jgi:hypothetical protein
MNEFPFRLEARMALQACYALSMPRVAGCQGRSARTSFNNTAFLCQAPDIVRARHRRPAVDEKSVKVVLRSDRTIAEVLELN